MNRENVYAAFFALLQDMQNAPFTTVSRRLAFVEDLAPEYFPCVYQNQVSEQAKQYTFQGVACWGFTLDLYVYAIQPDTDAPSTPLLNPLVDKVCEILGVSSETIGVFEVDGHSCGIMLNGTINTFEGLLKDRAVSVIPIALTVPFA